MTQESRFKASGCFVFSLFQMGTLLHACEHFMEVQGISS
jgi:hypothetical protein